MFMALEYVEVCLGGEGGGLSLHGGGGNEGFWWLGWGGVGVI